MDLSNDGPPRLRKSNIKSQEIPVIHSSSTKNNIVNNHKISSTSSYLNFQRLAITEKPKCNDVWEAYLTNIISFECFYVLNKKNWNFIFALSQLLQLDKFKLIPSKKLPSVGSIVAAHASNGLWYRAKIIKKNTSGVYVSFIDFGVSETLVKEIKNLPTELKVIKPLAYQCFFTNSSTDTEQMLSLYSDFLDSTIKKLFNVNVMVVTFMNQTEPYSVKISYNGVDIHDIFSELVWEGIFPGFNDSINLAKNEMLHKLCMRKRVPYICIQPIKSTEHFYIETKQSHEDGIQIRSRIENRTNWISVPNPNVGDIVLAKIEGDSQYYRARLTLKYENSYFKCFLIDCGTFAMCSEFFDIADSYLLNTPPVKIHCALYSTKKVKKHLLQYVSLGFMNVVTENSVDGTPKYMNFINVGSPCAVNLKMPGLRIHGLIDPCEVRVIYVEHINLFMVRVESKDARKIIDSLRHDKTTKLVQIVHPVEHKTYVTNYNGQYKRVKYIGPSKCNPSEFDVLLMDGIRTCIMTRKLFELPEDLQDVNVVDMQCSLDLDPHVYSTNKFIYICKNGKTKFTMVTIKNNRENGYHVKLFLGTYDVTSLLLIGDN